MGSVSQMLNADITYKVDKAKYNLKKDTRKAQNIKEKSNQDLANYTRALRNKIQMENAGENYNQQQQQIANVIEQSTSDDINYSLEASNQLGQLTARSGALGVGGSSIDILNDTVNLQNEIRKQESNRSFNRGLINATDSASSTIEKASKSQDFSRSFGNFDYTVDIAPQEMSNRYLKMIGASAATYFGGPMAGQAVTDYYVGQWKASNGDMQGYGQNLSNSARLGFSALKDAYGRKQANGGWSSWASNFFGNTETEEPKSLDEDFFGDKVEIK